MLPNSFSLQAIEKTNTKNVIILLTAGTFISATLTIRAKYNKVDYTTKMKKYFDHYLKGAPAPKWISEGELYGGK